MQKFIETIAPYETVWKVLLILAIVALILCVMITLILYTLNAVADRQSAREDLKSVMGEDFKGRSIFERADVMQKIVAPDGIDPNADPSLLVLNDSGKNVFIRNFTAVSIGKKTEFAHTFTPILNFSSATSSFSITPISNEEMQRLVNKHITTLTTERNRSDDVNRSRQLGGQLAAENDLADQLESGNSSYYHVSLVVSIRADSLEKLSSMTDNLISTARHQGVYLSNCFAAQSEAFLSAAPLNQTYKKEIRLGILTDAFSACKIKSDSIEKILMDDKSLSTIFNYQQNDFDQKEGAYLGWNVPSHSIARWDPFLSKSGFIVIFAGMTRSGKSVTCKVMANRMAHNTSFVAVDSQKPAGLSAGEYTVMAKMLNGTVYNISNDAGSDILNIFEVSVTTKAVMDDYGHVTGEEFIFPLNDLKVSIANIIMMIITHNSATSETTKDMQTAIKINGCVTKTITQLYDELRIYDGDPESLYNGNVEDRLEDRPKKTLPTLTNFYEKLAINMIHSSDEEEKRTYRLIMDAIQEYVRFCAFNKVTGDFYTQNEIEAFPTERNGSYYVLSENGEKQEIHCVRGSRLYYDGQSTINSSKKVRFTDIDISSLPESEVSLARSIAIHIVDQKFIKTNSEDPRKAERLVVIYDEAHYLFSDQYASRIIGEQARTCSKKNVSMWVSLQQLTDVQGNKDASVVLDNTAYLFLYKHKGKSKEFVQQVTGMTDSQFLTLCDLGGDVDSDSSKSRKGETCIVTGRHCYFVQVGYIKATEGEMVETDASERARIYNEKARERRADRQQQLRNQSQQKQLIG